MGFITSWKHHMMGRSRARKLSFFLQHVCDGRWPLILDVGVADEEHSPFDNFLEKHYPYPERITVLSVYPLRQFKKKYPSIKAFVYDGGVFPFADNTFEVVHSNAVVEHVGDASQQVRFIQELARVGRKFFLATPSRAFPIEMHTNLPFVHYLPKRIADKVMEFLGKGWAAGDYMHLLTKKRLVRILCEAGIKHYQIITKRFLGFPLHYYVIGVKDNEKHAYAHSSRRERL